MWRCPTPPIWRVSYYLSYHAHYVVSKLTTPQKIKSRGSPKVLVGEGNVSDRKLKGANRKLFRLPKAFRPPSPTIILSLNFPIPPSRPNCPSLSLVTQHRTDSTLTIKRKRRVGSTWGERSLQNLYASSSIFVIWQLGRKKLYTSPIVENFLMIQSRI